jgi:uncharacterized protein (DUF1697 family)
MGTKIAFLRAVNMAGHNSIKMNDLAGLFVRTGYPDPQIHIQSGNVIFRSNENELATAKKIEKAITDSFGLVISVMVRTAEELGGLKERNPFLGEKNFDPSRMAVVFLHEEPAAERLKKLDSVSYPPDRFEVSGREIFLSCPDGFGRSKLSTNFFEKKLGVTGTARNWRTIMTILEKAS